MVRFHIFAGNQNQAQYLAKTMGLEPSEWRYVGTVEGILGLRGGVLLCHGTWRHLPHTQEVLTRAKVQDMTILEVS